jgi:hypothetical protein
MVVISVIYISILSALAEKQVTNKGIRLRGGMKRAFPGLVGQRLKLDHSDFGTAFAQMHPGPGSLGARVKRRNSMAESYSQGNNW